MISSATTGEVAEPEDIPNGPADPAPAPGPAPAGWRDIQPELSAEPYVFATGEPPPGVSAFAVIREDEGVTLVLARADADRVGLAYGYVAARITLRVGSALTDVGLTALFSRILADAGISCNVIAGLAHDHLRRLGSGRQGSGPAPRPMTRRATLRVNIPCAAGADLATMSGSERRWS